MRRTLDRIGIALIALALAAGLLLGRGELEPLLVRLQSGGARLSSIETTEAPVASQPETGEPAPAAEYPGKLGAPPEPRLVYPHLKASESTDTLQATHKFRYEGHTYRVTVSVNRGLYESAARSPDRMVQLPEETEDQRLIAYYRYMVQDPAQAPVISATALQLRAIAKRRQLDRNRYAELIAKYVQTMPYDFAKLEAQDRSTVFPVVTLVDGTGVCGDKSLLLAALLAHEGYDTALLLFDAEKHMAVGIKGPGKEYNDCGYLFIESTAPTYVSEIPQSYISGVTLTSDPLVIPIGEGDGTYSKAKDVARILKVRAGTKAARDKLFEDASDRALSLQEAAKINAKLDVAYKSQFKLGLVEDHEPEFLDRSSAIAWIKKNCWWD